MREEGAVDPGLDSGRQNGGNQACLPLMTCSPQGSMTASGLEPLQLLLLPPMLLSQHGGLSLWSSLGPSLL